MLKITYNGTAGEQRWTLCGQLSGPWVEEWRSIWERGRGESNGRTCVIDLSDVTSIDERGERLLRTLKEDGARFVARGIDMRHILKHLRSRTKPSLRRSLAHLDRDGNCS
jgi:anti-anti-sigma regulatory factor